MQITFNLPHVFSAESDSVENAYVLRALLDCLITTNLAYLQNHSAPALYQSRVVYGRTIWWEPIPALYRRRYGDCKSLTAALISQYRRKRISSNPVFRFVPNRDGTTDYHILVMTKTGFEDPSKELGMGKEECAKFYRKGNFTEVY